MELNWFIGIDVSKKTFDVAFNRCNNPSKHYVYLNDKEGIKSFFKCLKEEKVILNECLVCLEHTGVYTHLILKSLDAKGVIILLELALTI